MSPLLPLTSTLADSIFHRWSADTIGRRRVLAAGALLMAGSGVSALQIAKPNVLTLQHLQVVFYFSASYVGLLAAAVLGIVSPSGNEGTLLAILGAADSAS